MPLGAGESPQELLALHEALELIELRFFGGLT
jgi:hypothetical protein